MASWEGSEEATRATTWEGLPRVRLQPGARRGRDGLQLPSACCCLPGRSASFAREQALHRPVDALSRHRELPDRCPLVEKVQLLAAVPEMPASNLLGRQPPRCGATLVD